MQGEQQVTEGAGAKSDNELCDGSLSRSHGSILAGGREQPLGDGAPETWTDFDAGEKKDFVLMRVRSQ